MTPLIKTGISLFAFYWHGLARPPIRSCFRCLKSVLKIWAKQGKVLVLNGEIRLPKPMLSSGFSAASSPLTVMTALVLCPAPTLDFPRPGVIFSALSPTTLHPAHFRSLFTLIPRTTCPRPPSAYLYRHEGLSLPFSPPRPVSPSSALKPRLGTLGTVLCS